MQLVSLNRSKTFFEDATLAYRKVLAIAAKNDQNYLSDVTGIGIMALRHIA